MKSITKIFINPKGVLHCDKKCIIVLLDFWKNRDISKITNSVYMLLKIGMTHNECDHDICMLV